MEYKEVAKARIKSLHEDLVVLDKESISLRESIVSTTVSLQERKRNMEKLGLTFPDFKADLRKVSMEHYRSEIININIKHIVSSLHETLLQVGILGISDSELELDKDLMESIREVASQAKPVFSSEKGECIVANESMYNEIFQAVDARLSSEMVLKNTFDMIPTDKGTVV